MTNICVLQCSNLHWILTNLSAAADCIICYINVALAIIMCINLEG